LILRVQQGLFRVPDEVNLDLLAAAEGET